MKKQKTLNQSLSIRDDLRSRKSQQLASMKSKNSRILDSASSIDHQSITQNKSQKSQLQKIVDSNIPKTARRIPQDKKGVYIVSGQIKQQNKNNQSDENQQQRNIQNSRININTNGLYQKQKTIDNLADSKVKRNSKVIENADLEQQKIQYLNNNLSSLSMSVSNIKDQYTDLKHSESQIMSNIKKKNSQNGALNVALKGIQNSPKSKQKQLKQSVTLIQSKLYQPKSKRNLPIQPPANIFAQENNIYSNKKRAISKLDDPKICEFIYEKQIQQQKRQKRRLQQIQKIQNERYLKQQKQFQQKQEAKIQKMNQIKSYSFIKQKRIQKKAQQAIKLRNSSQIAKKYKKSLPLFEIKQKQKLQNQIKKVQEIKEFLKKHKQESLKKQFLQKAIEQHKKWHTQQLQKLDKQKIEQRNKIMAKIQQENQKFKNFYRGKATEVILNQIKDRQLKKEIPQIYKERIKDYQGFVRENMKPKIKPMLRKQMRSNSGGSLQMRQKRQTGSNLSFRQIKRYKYLHGVSYGQVIQERPMAKSYEENRRLGVGYLQFMKSLPKKPKSIENQLQSYSKSISLPKPPLPNVLKHNRRKRPTIKLNSQPTRDQINMVLDQLRLNDKKIKQKQRMAKSNGPENQQSAVTRKQINDQLVLNLEKKMNLLHKLEQNDIELNSQD